MRRLLLDEMLSPEIAVQLRRRGHDVTAVVEAAELCSTPDDDLLAHAAREGRVLVTMNVGDFMHIDATWKSEGRTHAGLVLVPSSAFPHDRGFIGRMVRALDRALRADDVPAADAATFLQPDARSRGKRGPSVPEG